MSTVTAETFDLEIPSRRAQIMSAVRATLHGTVIVALVLSSFFGVDNLTAIVAGLPVGLIAALRSRRICVAFTAEGVRVNNYFRSYEVSPLAGATLHLYLRNRTELEPQEGRQFVIQSATLLDDDHRDALIAAMEQRGATISSPSQDR